MPERLNVNPTRMELSKLKSRLKMAVRGHKLLKDKSDEFVRQFIIKVKENKDIRERVENKLSEVIRSFLITKAVSDEKVISEILSIPTKIMELSLSETNIMNVSVPKIKIKKQAIKEIFTYSFADVTAEMDEILIKLVDIAEDMVKLAEVEKTCIVLASEIEKNRRRVNALEYVMIPQIEETIKYITMKLDENERGNIVRLMKVKEIIGDK